MPRKVVPGSITEPYKIGQGDFSPNLVGQQFTQGSTLFTLGNFAITTNTSGSGISKVYNTGSFSESYSLETLNLTEQDSQILSNESIKIILNLDPTNLERFVYFGSFYEFISATIKSILLKWKGSLYVNIFIPTDETQTPRNTILNYSYDSVNNKSYFKIPTSTIINNFALFYQSEFGGESDENQNPLFNPQNNYGDIYNLNTNFSDYQISNVFGDFYITNFTGSTKTDPYIYLEVNDNVWPPLESIGFGSYNYHVRPKEEILNKYFFNQLDEFESQVLNQLTTPQYTINIQSPKKTDKGNVILSQKKLTWPTSDGYNLDNGGAEFQSYITVWLNEAKDFDELKTDLIARRFVTGSIIEFDTDGGGNEVYGRKVNKLLRIYGREFDEIKKYIDGISFARVVTYSKKDNAPDELIKILASEMGLDVLLSFFDNNLFQDVLPGNTTQEGYGNLQNVPFSGYSRNLSPKEMDVELWRRLVINAWWLFKSKGHRKVLEFFLTLFGIKSCVISLDEYIYIAENAPLNVEKTLTTIANYLELDVNIPTTVTPATAVATNIGDIDISDYPIDIYGFPKLAINSPGYYYQNNGFWYNGGNLSETGNNPHLGPYDYGKAYLGALECFVENFEGVTTGTTTFNTIDNLFTDYENGTIENGLNNFGPDYAEIMSNTNRISGGINVISAGADTTLSYGDSEQSFRILFNVNDCIIPCPELYINYGNGVIFIGQNFGNSINITLEQFPELFQENTTPLVEALQISEICCAEAGGYYLPQQQNDIPLAEDVFTIPELFDQNNALGLPQPETPRNVCWWCPPTKVLCGLDYYNTVDISPTFTQRQVGAGEADIDDDKDITGCIDPQALNYNPLATISCGPSGPYTPDLGGQLTSGCCIKNNTIPDTEGGGTDLEIAPIPCTGLISQNLNQEYFIDGTAAREECCTELVIGSPVSFIGGVCVPTPIENSPCNPEQITLGTDGVVGGINEEQCCNIDVVGQPVFWDGFSCRLLDENLCVILTNDNQNIINEECCSLKGGYLGTDFNGNVICIQNTNQSGEPIGDTDETQVCPETYLLTLTETIISSDTGDYSLLSDSTGQVVSQECCSRYNDLVGDSESWYYNINLGGCVKQIEEINYVATRYQLVESFMGEVSLFHAGDDLGIYSLLERIFLKITKLNINGIDYLQTVQTPGTIIDPTVNPPDEWNSVLFLQKVFNDLGLTNYKAQVPGTPANVNIPTNTVGVESDSFKEYGFYIIGPKGDTFEIDVDFYTASTPPPNGQFVFNWFRESSSLLGDPNNPRFKPAEPGYVADNTISPTNESCFTITKPPYGSEPEQCYPYTLGPRTYE